MGFNSGLNLGEIIDTLETIYRGSKNPEELIIDGMSNSFYSYRGYYEDLTIPSSVDKTLLRDVLNGLRGCLKKTFQGYKGGQYKMSLESTVWNADYSVCADRYFVGFAKHGNVIKAITHREQ